MHRKHGPTAERSLIDVTQSMKRFERDLTTQRRTSGRQRRVLARWHHGRIRTEFVESERLSETHARGDVWNQDVDTPGVSRIESEGTEEDGRL